MFWGDVVMVNGRQSTTPQWWSQQRAGAASVSPTWLQGWSFPSWLGPQNPVLTTSKSLFKKKFNWRIISLHQNLLILLRFQTPCPPATPTLVEPILHFHSMNLWKGFFLFQIPSSPTGEFLKAQHMSPTLCNIAWPLPSLCLDQWRNFWLSVPQTLSSPLWVNVFLYFPILSFHVFHSRRPLCHGPKCNPCNQFLSVTGFALSNVSTPFPLFILSHS